MSDALSSITDNNETKPPEIVMMSMGDLYVPDWNPRKYINETEMQKLVDYRKNGGQVPSIWLWKGPGHAPWAIISGQRRWIADTRLGKTHIPSIILDIPLEEAMILSFASNTDSKPHWLETVIAIEKLYEAQTKKSQDKLGARLGGVTGARINYALKVAKALNPASRALIVNSVNDLGPENACSEVAVRALAGVLTPEQVEKALPVFLARQMTETQAKNLAEHVKAGNPADSFDHLSAKAPKTKSVPKTGAGSESQPASLKSPAIKAIGDSEKVSIHSETQHAKAGKVPNANGHDNEPLAQPNHAPRLEASAQVPQMSETESLVVGELVGISIISRLKAKVKKDEKLTWGEYLLLAGHDTVHYGGKTLKWIYKHLVKDAAKLIKTVWKTVIEALKITGFYPLARGLFVLAVCAFVIWFAWEAYFYGFTKPVKIIASKIPVVRNVEHWLEKPSTASAPPQVQPVQAPVVSKPTSMATPVGTLGASASSPSPQKASGLSPTANAIGDRSAPTGPQQSASVPDSSPKGISDKQEIGASSVVAQATPAVSPYAKASGDGAKPSNDVVGQVAGSVAGDAVKSLLHF